MKKRLVAMLLVLACVVMTACGTQGAQDNNTQGSLEQSGQEQTGQEQNQAGQEANEQDDPSGNEQSGTEAGGSDEGTMSQENPVTVVFELEDKSMKTDAGELFFEASYNKPVVSIRGNQAAADKINQYFEQNKDEFEGIIADYKQDAEDFYTAIGGEAYFMWCSNHSVSRADAGTIAIVQTEETYLGGAHGSNYSVGYNFDAQTGELLTIKDLSNDPTGFTQAVIANVVAQCKEIPEQEGFFEPVGSEEFAETIGALLENGSWYFAVEGLVVVANPYDIAPYAAGAFTFVIPYDELEGLLDQYGMYYEV